MFEVQGLRRDATLSAEDGDPARTVALLRKALALETSDTSHLELGLALLDADQPAEAIEHFNAAARLNAPYHVHQYLAEAYKALGRLDDSRREQASYERIHREALRRRAAGPLNRDTRPDATQDPQ
jgi:tetratricopeptide (TPR) repeat protein